MLQFVPNGLIYILAGYAFAEKTIKRKDYFFSSIILAILGFIAKVFNELKLESTSNSLPQILILFACIFLLIYGNKISTMHAIVSSLTVMLVQLIFELIYMVIILQGIFGVDADLIFDQSTYMYSLIGLPYLFSLGLSILLLYKIRIKRRMNNEYT